MKKLSLILFFLFSLCAHGQPAKELPNGGTERYNILMAERQSILNEIEALATDLPTIKDQTKRSDALKRLATLNRNLEDIGKEIAKAEKEPPTRLNYPQGSKTDEKVVQKKEELPQKQHETWDVFRSF